MKLYKRNEVGTIETFYLDSTYGWTMNFTDQTATSPVPPGAAVWINTPPGQSVDRTVFTGFEHGTSSVVRLYQDAWTLFSWPFGVRREADLGTDSERGWGFSAAGAREGTSRRNSDVIYHPVEQKYLWLDGDGRWNVWGGSQDGNITFVPGDAYFYFSTGTNFNWTPLPRQ